MYTQNVPLTAYLNQTSLFTVKVLVSGVLAQLRNASAHFKSGIVWDVHGEVKYDVIGNSVSAAAIS